MDIYIAHFPYVQMRLQYLIIFKNKLKHIKYHDIKKVTIN